MVPRADYTSTTSPVVNWQRTDNHKYLFAYLAFAVAAALTVP